MDKATEKLQHSRAPHAWDASPFKPPSEDTTGQRGSGDAAIEERDEDPRRTKPSPASGKKRD
jgi:hypothetical protein